ncbi:MAG: MGMT family protein [Patulibacter sp.]
MPSGSRADAVLRAVRAIPEGYVRTYGDLDPGAPRFPGRVLATHPDAAEVPWHRVVRADGSLAGGVRQRERLLAEGVAFRGERVDLRLARLPLDPGEHLDAD